jgi:hypothetical protein
VTAGKGRERRRSSDFDVSPENRKEFGSTISDKKSEGWIE